MKIAFHCCFCGGTMPEEDESICAVILISNWTGPEEEQLEQQFFCHPACFEEKSGEKIRAPNRAQFGQFQ